MKRLGVEVRARELPLRVRAAAGWEDVAMTAGATVATAHATIPPRARVSHDVAPSEYVIRVGAKGVSGVAIPSRDRARRRAGDAVTAGRLLLIAVIGASAAFAQDQGDEESRTRSGEAGEAIQWRTALRQ